MLGGCEPRPNVEQTITAYASAVQQRDFATLYCLSAGAATAEELGADEQSRRASFQKWAESLLLAYEEGRDEGEVLLDGHGILLVKLLALGRGTFSDAGSPQVAEDGTTRVRADIRFGYDSIDLSRFSPGTTLYFNRSPVGRVEPLTVPWVSREVRLDVLESVSVDWTLMEQEAAGGCPAGWTVVSVEPVAGSASTTRLTWDF